MEKRCQAEIYSSAAKHVQLSAGVLALVCVFPSLCLGGGVKTVGVVEKILNGGESSFVSYRILVL